MTASDQTRLRIRQGIAWPVEEEEEESPPLGLTYPLSDTHSQRASRSAFGFGFAFARAAAAAQ